MIIVNPKPCIMNIVYKLEKLVLVQVLVYVNLLYYGLFIFIIYLPFYLSIYIHLFVLIGSYTDSRGVTLIRKHAEEFITKRDGFKADFENIYLVNGATDGIKVMSQLP